MAILNQRDYKLGRARLAELKNALGRAAVVDDLASHLSAEITDARREAIRAEAKRLEDEIAAFEELQSSGEAAKELSTDDLGMLPIVARVARRLSQRDLADRVEVSEQQIQRYESDRYGSISLSRYKKILEILGVELQSRLKPSWSDSQTTEKSTRFELELDYPLISEIRKNNWVQLPKNVSKDKAAQLLATYIAGGTELGRGRSLHRRQIRYDDINDSLTETALAIWQARVLQQASIQRHKLKAKFNIIDTSWLSKLAKLSRHLDGPPRAIEFLRECGIILVIVPHLPHTRLDGAAMLLADGTPVIALTLRHDRIDSFWFTLFHECAHVCLHFNHGLDSGFIDDMDVDVGEDRTEERNADLFALSALIPEEVWETAPARFSKSPNLIRQLADKLGIHPAIVVGRIQKERGDYRTFNDLLGRGTVRSLLSDQLTEPRT